MNVYYVRSGRNTRKKIMNVNSILDSRADCTTSEIAEKAGSAIESVGSTNLGTFIYWVHLPCVCLISISTAISLRSPLYEEILNSPPLLRHAAALPG